MFWDKISPLYDLFENIYNHNVYVGTGLMVEREIDYGDNVLECACGTGAISVYITKKSGHLVATDYSKGMLKQTAWKLRHEHNAIVRKADMTNLKCKDNRFDKVVAGNVIHLLDNPKAAVGELYRVCKVGGKIIIPTYINIYKGKTNFVINLLDKFGAKFKRQFDLQSYMKFFEDAGYTDVKYHVIKGNIPCAIAVITKH